MWRRDWDLSLFIVWWRDSNFDFFIVPLVRGEDDKKWSTTKKEAEKEKKHRRLWPLVIVVKILKKNFNFLNFEWEKIN